jgi:putative aminopeptidase FrvX
MNTAAKKFLYSYLNTSSPTRYEATGQQVWADYLRPYVDEIRSDNYGTVYGIINPEAEYKVVIEAHADEICWMVGQISDEGFISVVRNGGSDHAIAPSKVVNVHTDNGIVKGVFGWPAIHTRAVVDVSPTLDNIFIDVGAADKQAVLDMGIYVGCLVTYPDELWEMNDTYYVGRALDNRIGGFMIAEVARLIKENNVVLPFGLYIVNSVQEEVGLNGAQMIVETIRPNVAIVTDVAHDGSTPLMPKQYANRKCGAGPIVPVAPAVHRNLFKLITDVAAEQNIAFQREALPRVTGTDTDAFAFSTGGVVSALISLPLRYMHTTVETVAKSDVEAVIQLIYHSLLKIENNHNFKYI